MHLTRPRALGDAQQVKSCQRTSDHGLNVTWYHRFEAKGLQAYILRTNRLQEIKAGSLLVARLQHLAGDVVTALELELEGDPTLAAGAGTLPFRTRDDAARFARVWPLVVDQQAPGVQVIQATQEGGEADWEEVWDGLQRQLRRRRNLLPADLPEAGPATARAPRTGLPAVATGPRPGTKGRDKELLDRDLAHRVLYREYGRDPTGDRIAEDVPWSRDLEDDAVWSPYVALVHIDGSDLGLSVQKVASGGYGALRTWSNRLDEVTVRSAQEAYAACEARWSKAKLDVSRAVPMRPIVLGGDDLTVLLRASDAVPFVTAYLNAFERLSAEDPTLGRLTAGAGVAIVKRTYPFHDAHELAEALCGAAKRALRRADTDGRTPSAWCIHRVTTARTDSWSEILETELASPKGEGSLWSGPFVMRPESLERPGDDVVASEALLELVDAVGHLPNGPLREVLTLVKTSPAEADAAWKRLWDIGRTTTEGWSAHWPEFTRAWEAVCKGDALWRTVRDPARPQGSRVATPLQDVWTNLQARGEG